MEPNHQESVNRILEQVLCGDRSERDGEFLRILETEPEARERWERMRGLASQLDDMGRTERSIRTEASSPAAAHAESEAADRVAQMVREHYATAPTGSRPWFRQTWFWSGLAAAGLALTVWTLQRPDESPSASTTGSGLAPESVAQADPGSAAPRPEFETIVLSEGAAAFTQMTATDLGDRSYRLDWTDSQASFGRTYRVRIHIRDGDRIGAAQPHLDSDELTAPTWTFAVPADHDPDRLTWSVEARDMSGGVGETSAVRHLVESRESR